MATFVAGQPYVGKVIDPSQGGAVVDYTPNMGSTTQAQQQQQSGVQLTPSSSAITPSALTPAQPFQPVVTQPTPIPDTSHLAPVDPSTNPANQPSQLGATESRIKSQIDELMGVNTALEGKAGYTASQNEALGVNAASDAITGLNSQLTGLINESKAIPLAIQQNAQQGGANVTKGGLAPIQTAQLRNNAIQSLAVSSQIDAMNGQLSNAIKKVDRAVALKYADLEARSATLTKNLELLKNDPSLTLEQQDRVDKKLAAQKAYDAQLADKKKIETDTHDAILKALANNTGNAKLTPEVVSLLQSAQTPEDVAGILQLKGLSSISKSDQLDQTLKQAQIDKANYDLAHPNRQTQVVDVAGHKMLIDTNTGDTIKDYGSTAIGGVAGQADQTTQSWADLITNGKATIKDVPAAYKNAVSVQLSQNPEIKQATELQQTALTSAKDLLNKFTSGNGTFAVGGTRLLGTQYIPGTAPYDFQVNYDNLKSLLSLDNVKYLKGQGQVSDAERRLLQDASSKLNTGSSEAEFKKALNDIITVLTKTEDYSKNTNDVVTAENAKQAFSQIQLQPGTTGKLSSGLTYTIE